MIMKVFVSIYQFHCMSSLVTKLEREIREEDSGYQVPATIPSFKGGWRKYNPLFIKV
jgi:hypothetical protein